MNHRHFIASFSYSSFLLFILKISYTSHFVATAFAISSTGGETTKKAVYLGIDVGTQGTKIVAYCPQEASIIATASRSYDVMPTEVTGRAEQDPSSTWMPAIEECLMEVGHTLQLEQQDDNAEPSSYRIKGIGVSGQQHGMVALDSQLEPLRPAKLWCDVEAVQEANDLKDYFHSQQGQGNLDFLTPSFTAPKILWMKRNEPELYDKAKWFILPHDYVILKLANLRRPITDAGDASGNGFFLAAKRENSPIIAQAIDQDSKGEQSGESNTSVLEKLPTILSPNQVTGILDDYYVQKLLPWTASGMKAANIKAIPVSVGSGDNMCSALGVGCVSPGQAVMSLGTSGTIFAVSKRPPSGTDPSSLAPFCDATGQYLPLACTISCTGVLTQVLKEWTDFSSHEEASKYAASVPIGCHGITFLPYLGGERTPNWPHATGAILGLTSSNFQYAKDPAVIYRACLEAITFLLANALEEFPNKNDIDTLLVVGGGAKNPFWQQMIADITNRKLIFPLETETAALGAAFQAGAAASGMAVEEYVKGQAQALKRSPDTVQPQNHKAYEEAAARFRQFGSNLFDKRI
ncbi:unnamed protein product [Cylindrotheca closterium]|uniref:glycerol kinase n=1 Tax=Cylindrotheca closterium TaxID=2856 RepID=A0AAD2FTB5_9STRA|nr:unnamed protein product [Cylindrotheca closterium]